jgi:hypothetical protein
MTTTPSLHATKRPQLKLPLNITRLFHSRITLIAFKVTAVAGTGETNDQVSIS